MLQNKSLKDKWLKFMREEAKPLIIMFLVMCAFRSAIADWNDVPTGSMKPTIMEGDRVLVNKLAYDLKIPFTTTHLAQWGDPQRGEIVVFYSPADEKRLVKRVVGIPGDTVQLINNRLFVNGKPADYEALAKSTINEIPTAEQSSHEFARESASEHPHAVMTTPAMASVRSFGPITVPTGQYFMMGDNRDNSYDSRYWGTVERSRIVGRTSSVVMSLNPEAHYFPRWHRFFTTLP